MSAREEILRRIRQATAGTRPGPVPPASVPVAAGDLVELFAERVADYRATVRTVSPGELSAAVAAALPAGTVVVPPDLPESWVDGRAVERDPGFSVSEVDAFAAVVTGCAVAVAETGTVVLDAGFAQGRRLLTLIPDHHVCVVFTDQIVADVPEAVARLDAVRPQTWISGPSATSDIELNRVEGVHGPRNLTVLIATRG
ncbi:lactate utilization protein C [Pseudonocardiaceae bacterium YIM PH 21723]|nr:lactate utilization protein C [Pseudonocardiaceae bacterium YIM PH 21723]